jgi:GT2 family glycosyltransferase
MTTFPADVDVAIVAYNNLDVLPATLTALADAGCPADRITVVDVASTDGTGEWLGREWPTVRVRRLSRNDGPSPGRNVGITEASRRFVMLLDADVRVQPQTVQRLHDAMVAAPEIKVGSPIVVHEDRPDIIQYAGGSLHFICEAINPWLDRPLADRGLDAQDISAAPTCGLLLDREAAIEVGLFDERYFIGKEDGDFTHRVCLAGYRILELPEALVLHRSRPRGTWLFYYQIRNRWHFMLKNYQWRTLIAILPCLLIHEPLQLLVLHLQGHGLVYWKSVAGLLGMLPALPRDRGLMRRIRKVPDARLLKSDALIVRGDFSRNPLVRFGKGGYERLLRGYWRLLTSTVLAG